MNTYPENESGVKTVVEDGRPKGIKRFTIRTKRRQGSPRWIPPLDVPNVARPLTPKPRSHPEASGSTATGGGDVNRGVDGVRARPVRNNIVTEACTSGLAVGSHGSGSTAMPTVRDDQGSIRGNVQSTSDAI